MALKEKREEQREDDDEELKEEEEMMDADEVVDEDDEEDEDEDDDEDDYFSNVDAAFYWSSWSEENVHVIGLVDNDVVKRTRALKRLKSFLKTRSADEENPFEEKDLLKIWKGLHYSMWHSDKLLVQQELAGTLADLIFCFSTTSSAVLFVKCFFATIVREWDGIDAHRLNKFLTLIRRVWRSSLLFLKKQNWDSTLVSEILQILRETMIRPNATSADGLTFHMIDVYVDELTKVGGGVGGKAAPPRPSALNQDAVFDFLRPYVVFCLKEKNRLLVKAVVRDVFDALVGQVEEDFEDEIGEDGFEMHGKIDNQKLEGPLDKGQGIDETPGTRLAVDFGRVGGYILKLAGGKKVHANNRNTLYKVAATYENLSKGIYPWEEIEVEENEGKKKDGGMRKEEIDKAVRRMEKENERLGLEPGKKRKKQRKRNDAGDDEEEEGGDEGNEEQGDLTAIDDEDDFNDEDIDDDDEPIQKKKKKSKSEPPSNQSESQPLKKSQKNNADAKQKKLAMKKTNRVKQKRSPMNGKTKGLSVESRSGAWTVKA